VAEIVPQDVTEQVSVQAAPWLDISLTTVAVILLALVPAATFNVVGVTLIPIVGADVIVTAAVPFFVPSATDVAVIVIFGGAGTAAGAVYVNVEPA